MRTRNFFVNHFEHRTSDYETYNVALALLVYVLVLFTGDSHITALVGNRSQKNT